MLPRINTSSGVPLSRQISKEIKAAYLKGLVQPGARLLSVREMASALAINPATVVKAYDLLQAEGLIVRRQGQGAFIIGRVRSMRAVERKALLAELASELAVEGLRLGVSEEGLLGVLRHELEGLRPRKVDSK